MAFKDTCITLSHFLSEKCKSVKEQLCEVFYILGWKVGHNISGHIPSIPNYNGGWETFLVGCSGGREEESLVNS